MSVERSTFFGRIAELQHLVGDGDLVIKVEVDQVYARYQEVGISRFSGRPLRHPHGGQSHFARDGLYNHLDSYLEELARSALSDIEGAAIRVGDSLRENIAELTPMEWANLARSGHTTVTSRGETIYDRPPDVPRLSDADLDAQRRSGGFMDYGRETQPRLF